MSKPRNGKNTSDSVTHCVNCGALLVRRDGETNSSFKRRSCCSRECARARALAAAKRAGVGGNRHQETWRDPVPSTVVAGILVEWAEGENVVEKVHVSSRLHVDHVRRIVNGRVESVCAGTVDRILCRLGLTHLWWTDPVLSEVYERRAA